MSAEFKDRLQTVDERGHRLWVYADIVQGPWRNRRKFVAGFLILLYLTLPWLQLNSKPVLQFDFLNFKFWILAHDIRFHQTPIILSLVMGSIFLILSFTALGGRLWCGWACPQSVFLEFIYRPIERWIEGYPGSQKKLDAQKWNAEKIFKKLFKWVIYFLISFVIANTFVAYFVGGQELLHLMSLLPTQNPIFFGIMTIVFGLFVFNFGWFREQMCTIVCPYGRFQSVLLDKNSLIISYDIKRDQDCIDCYRCVQVCPTGIDIRNGLQLECLNCAACIDACNIVMNKVKRAPDLIKYSTETLIQGALPLKSRFIRPTIYFLISALLLSFATYKIFVHPTVEIIALRKLQDPVMKNEQIVINQLGFKLENTSDKIATLFIFPKENDFSIITAQNPVILNPKEIKHIELFIEIHKNQFKLSSLNSILIFKGERFQKIIPITLFSAENINAH